MNEMDWKDQVNEDVKMVLKMDEILLLLLPRENDLGMGNHPLDRNQVLLLLVYVHVRCR